MWEWVTDEQLLGPAEPDDMSWPLLTKPKPVGRRPAPSWFDPACWMMGALLGVVTLSMVAFSFLFGSRQAVASTHAVAATGLHAPATPAVTSAALSAPPAQPATPGPAVGETPVPVFQNRPKAAARRLSVARTARGLARRARVDELFDESFPGMRSDTPAPVTYLTHDNILAHVRVQAKSLAGCVTKARDWGEISSGRTTLILEWTINADGSITQARLTGPAHVMSTLLPDCVIARMQSWQFPSSARGAPVKNFPLTVSLR